MSLALLALGLAVVSILCSLGVTLVARRRVSEAYVAGWSHAGARLVGVVAAELGPEHPLVDRMVERLGAIEVRR